jgi:hypothetical protein
MKSQPEQSMRHGEVDGKVDAAKRAVMLPRKEVIKGHMMTVKCLKDKAVPVLA